jgi:hypothetical protein
MLTGYFITNIFTNEKSPKNITFNYKIIYMLGMLLYVIQASIKGKILPQTLRETYVLKCSL